MSRFTHPETGHSVETSNAVEGVTLKASGYREVADEKPAETKAAEKPAETKGRREAGRDQGRHQEVVATLLAHPEEQ